MTPRSAPRPEPFGGDMDKHDIKVRPETYRRLTETAKKQGTIPGRIVDVMTNQVDGAGLLDTIMNSTRISDEETIRR